MTFAETIARNCAHVQPGWWARYAYHYTDLINAISILTSGHLYSRIQADGKWLMRNDNASRQVIDMTSSRATSYVRFYFRPLTPTQYHNEGYKHPAIRYCGDENANVPVPIFFLFDLEMLLSRQETCFSALTQAGHGNPLQSGEEAFAALPFEQIYSSGSANRDTLKYRLRSYFSPSNTRLANRCGASTAEMNAKGQRFSTICGWKVRPPSRTIKTAFASLATGCSSATDCSSNLFRCMTTSSAFPSRIRPKSATMPADTTVAISP